MTLSPDKFRQMYFIENTKRYKSNKYNTNSYEQTMGEPHILVKEVMAWL